MALKKSAQNAQEGVGQAENGLAVNKYQERRKARQSRPTRCRQGIIQRLSAVCLYRSVAA